MEKKKRVSYKDGANGQFLFDDGQTLKFSSVAIKEKSPQLFEKLLGSESDELVKIHDIEAGNFKLFLYYFLSTKKPKISDVFRIISIPHGYELHDYVNELISMLKPEELNEDVILALNVSLRYGFVGLTCDLISFLKERSRIYKFFDEEKYYLLLEPKAIAMLCKQIRMDTEVLNSVMNWGKNYLNKNNDSTDLKTLIKKHNILETLKPSSFESYENLINFTSSDFGKDFFTIPQIINYMRCLEDVKSFPEKSIWVKVKAGDKIQENFTWDVDCDEKEVLSVEIERNPIVFLDRPENLKVLVHLDVDSEYSSSEHHSSTVDNKHDYLGSDLLDFTIEKEYGKSCYKELEVNCTWIFNTDCRILKTYCEYSHMGSENGYFFCGKVKECKANADDWL